LWLARHRKRELGTGAPVQPAAGRKQAPLQQAAGSKEAPAARRPALVRERSPPGQVRLFSERPIAHGIQTKVTEVFAPRRLLVKDNSAAHRGLAGVVGVKTPETHFLVEVVSAAFQGVSKLERQRQVQDLLREEFDAGLHALELTCRTPAEDERVHGGRKTR
ncbi:unnamed protein product, partial [Polarella glacialis]